MTTLHGMIMKKILIVYASNAGSTIEISQYLAKLMGTADVDVSVSGFQQVQDLDSYDAIILGAPMMRELHPGMVKFIQKHRQVLVNKQVALFVTCLRLSDNRVSEFMGIPVFKDSELVRAPRNAKKLTMIERKTSADAYISSLFESMPWFNPAQIAFFGGALNFSKLKLMQILFVLLLFQFKSIDKRNWEAIKTWSETLHNRL